jgi:hypothetical protein
MATTVTISNNPGTIVSLKPANKTFASVSVAPSANISMGSLTDVSVASVADGQTLIYNSANGKFESGAITATVTQLTGGKF